MESRVEQTQKEKLPKEIGILIIDLYLLMHYVHLHQICHLSMSKIIRIFPKKISSNNINLGAHILLMTFFDNFNSESTLFSKIMTIL